MELKGLAAIQLIREGCLNKCNKFEKFWEVLKPELEKVLEWRLTENQNKPMVEILVRC